MSNLIAPSLIIFSNTGIADQVLGVIMQQLFIDQVMDGYSFDGYVAANPNYPETVYADGYRILVQRPLNDLTNRELADLVLFFDNGLVYVERNKYGPPGATLTIQRCYLTLLIANSKIPPGRFGPCRCHNSFYRGFKGEPTNNCDFNPWHLDKPNVEPLDD